MKIFINTGDMLRPQRTNARTASRTTRGAHSGRNKDDYDFTDYENDKTRIA